MSNVTTSDIIEEIALERQRQKEKEGWSTAHDDSEHVNGELADAAACYAREAAQHAFMGRSTRTPPPDWPWDADWWKPKGPRRDLIRAAALIVAEIERLDRKGGS